MHRARTTYSIPSQGQRIATMGRFGTVWAQRQLLRCLSWEHPCKAPTYRSMHDQFKTAWGADFRTLGPVASIRRAVPAGAVGCRIQDPGAHGYRWSKAAGFSHSARTAHGASPMSPERRPEHPRGSSGSIGVGNRCILSRFSTVYHAAPCCPLLQPQAHSKGKCTDSIPRDWNG